MKSVLIVIGVSILAIGGLISLSFMDGGVSGQNGDSRTSGGTANNVSVIDGKQIVEITARGGYQPRKSVAKAGLPTTLKIDTNSSFDCSIALRIPAKKIAKTLPTTGVTEIDLGTNEPGTLRGTCSMGMYSFEIEFRS